ncbi:MAG: hypothetical protein ACAH80_11695 [Alphaproteobacteria bacterium]
MRIENTIIHLLGFPGAGKYTVAQEIVRQAEGIRLVDNHLINNPLFSLIRQDGKTKLDPRIWLNVRKIWDAVADTMVNIAPREFSFVLTNALIEGDEDDRNHMEKMRSVAEARGGKYIPVRLLVTDVDEHIRRITSASRIPRMKETNPEAPTRYATREVLKTGDARELTLDITRLGADEAAGKILAHAAI